MNEFWQLMGGEGEIAPAATVPDDTTATSAPKRLFRLSDSSGRIEFNEEKTGGKVRKSNFDSKDGNISDFKYSKQFQRPIAIVFVFDAGIEAFVWFGKGATANEKRLGIQYAQKYLNEYKRPAWLPISRVIEGGESEHFNNCLDPEEQKGYVPKKVTAAKDAAPAPVAQKR